MVESRTNKSIKNSIVALVYYLINLILQFFSRKIFIDHLGTEILGLNTTLSNLLQFLNLAELGIGTAIACTLYKPLFNKDQATIIEIISLQGWLYRRIAYIISGGALFLMCLFPWIFAKTPLPIWYAYMSFIALLTSALLSYFVNYRQILLSADQKDYKILYSYKSVILIKVLFQIIVVKYFNYGYIWWCILEVIFAFIASYALNKTILRFYPFLKTSISKGAQLRSKYPEIITKVKQIFFHKIAGFTLTQTSPLIIYAYTSLTLVALYGNYMLIITGATTLMAAIFNSMNAGVGNLVAQGDKQNILKVFNELFSIRFLISCVVCFAFYTLTPSFITLWLGSEYLMSNNILILMIAIMYINITRTSIDVYLNAYGLFRDIWAPITEAILNIGMSILLGYLFGITGILSGVLLSLIAIVFIWKPYFLFRSGFKISIIQYINMYIKHIIAAILTYIVTVTIIKHITINPTDSFAALAYSAAIYITIFSIILLALLYVLSSGLRDFIHRLLSIIKTQ